MTHSAFNTLHSLISETRFLLDEQGQFVEAYRSVLTYKYQANMHDQSPNYNRRSVTEVFHNTSAPPKGSPTFQPMSRTKYEYNNSGNVTSTSEEVYVPSSSTYTEKSSVSNGILKVDETDPAGHATTTQYDVRKSGAQWSARYYRWASPRRSISTGLADS